LLQLDDGFVSENVLDMIGDLIQLEKSSIKGVLGPWHAAAALWDRLRDRNLVNQESFRSKQILYRLGHLEQFAQSHDSSVRYLARADFKQWRPLRESFLSEEGLQLELSDVQLKHSYDDFVSRKLLWGLFDSEQRLVAMAGLNSKALNIGQIGGVYTVQSRRRQGLSSRTLLSMMADCYNELGIGRMILFTAEDNTGAQRLYESLGFLRVGHFGMIFS
jgi:RimJ/RimL family protein N-acetyltransferase